MEENKKLHIVRVKGKEDSTFYDPCTDIRVLLPCAVELVAGTLPEDRANYVKNCLYTMQLRLKEDATPMDKQLEEFMQAMNKMPQFAVLTVWSEIAVVLLILYAIYCRRDRKLLGPDQEALVSAAKVVADRFFTTLSDKADEFVHSDKPVTDNSFAVCEETGEIMAHIRELAARTVNADGASWAELADMCDKAFTAAGGEGDKTTLSALALAYPAYKDGDLRVDVELEK